MKGLCRFGLLLLASVLIFAIVASAAAHVTVIINNASFNYSTNQLTVNGQGFSPSGTAPVLTLNAIQLTLVSFHEHNGSGKCLRLVSSCNLPASSDQQYRCILYLRRDLWCSRATRTDRRPRTPRTNRIDRRDRAAGRNGGCRGARPSRAPRPRRPRFFGAKQGSIATLVSPSFCRGCRQFCTGTSGIRWYKHLGDNAEQQRRHRNACERRRGPRHLCGGIATGGNCI